MSVLGHALGTRARLDAVHPLGGPSSATVAIDPRWSAAPAENFAAVHHCTARLLGFDNTAGTLPD